MIAFEPNRSRTVSSVASIDEPCQPSNGNASWIAPSWCRFVKVMPISEATADTATLLAAGRALLADALPTIRERGITRSACTWPIGVRTPNALAS